MQNYLEKIKTLHKIERLNDIVGTMIGKLLLNKPTKLWDLYLDQALLLVALELTRRRRRPHFTSGTADTRTC